MRSDFYKKILNYIQSVENQSQKFSAGNFPKKNFVMNLFPNRILYFAGQPDKFSFFDGFDKIFCDKEKKNDRQNF